MNRKLLSWALRRELKRHEPAIRAEIDRLKAIRTLDELKVWGREKGGALGVLARERGPELMAFIKAEWARMRKESGRGR